MIFLMLTPTWCFADGNSELQDLVELSLERGPGHQLKKLELEQQRNLVKSKYASFLPTINAGLSRVENTIDRNESTSFDAKVSIKINLFHGFADISELKKAQLVFREQEESLRRSKSDLIYQVKKEYLGHLYAQELRHLLENIKLRRKQQLDFIAMRFQGGREDQGSYLQAKAKYEQIEYELLQSQRLELTTRQNLATKVGTEVHALPIMGANLEKLVSTEKIIFNDQWDVFVPEYKIAEYELEIADYDLTINNSSFSPSLDITGNFGKTGKNFQSLDSDNSTAAIVLTVPIFEGGSRFYQSTNARLQRKNREFNLKNSQNELKAKIFSSYNTYLGEYENIQIQKNFLTSSKVRSEVATIQYKSGTMNYTNWDQIQSDLIQAEKNILISLKTALLAEAELVNILGN